MKKVNILWTSGWDSTFRLLQLMEKGNIMVQPYYILDKTRNSNYKEKEQMQKIKELIYAKFPNSKELLLETKIIEKEKILENEIITSSYNKLLQESFMGNQYDWLGRLSKEIGDLELCIHEDDKAHYFIKDYVCDVEGEEGKYYIVDKNKSNQDIINVFGNYKFPILHYTKVQMMEEAKRKGCYYIMLETWFCFNPKNGKPCGVCNPCTYTIEEGMGFRLGKVARVKNRLMKIKKVGINLSKKIGIYNFFKKVLK